MPPGRGRQTISRVLRRYPFDSPWVRTIITRFWLPTWFATLSGLAIWFSTRGFFTPFLDARLYVVATRAWLDGANPWDVQINGLYFAAPPPTLIPLAPLAMLPLDLGVGVVALSVVVGAVATIRLLRLPWWWILFPPLVHSMLSGNVQALLVPLILLGAGPIAVLLKVYAGLPLLVLGRWRAVGITGLVMLVTVPLLPWESFIGQFPQISERLSEQSNYGLPTALLAILLPLALLALAVVGRERAAWLVVPAVWPAQQPYYGTLVLPTRSPLVTALVALPVPGSGLIALLVLAAVTWRSDRPERTRLRRVPVRPGPSTR